MDECGCYRCEERRDMELRRFPAILTKMIVCEHCGNKRCPHATNHRYACTRSNEPGQPGSRYTRASEDR